MDPMNKVKIRYNFRTKLKGEVTKSQKGSFGPPSRGGTRNKKLLTNLVKKNKKAA